MPSKSFIASPVAPSTIVIFSVFKPSTEKAISRSRLCTFFFDCKISLPGRAKTVTPAVTGFCSDMKSAFSGKVSITFALRTSSSDSICFLTSLSIASFHSLLLWKSVFAQSETFNKSYGLELEGVNPSEIRILRAFEAAFSSFTVSRPSDVILASMLSSDKRTTILSLKLSSFIAMLNTGTADGAAERFSIKIIATITASTIPPTIAFCTIVHFDHKPFMDSVSFLIHSFMRLSRASITESGFLSGTDL